jgi:NADH pyrophosphatase NudC (nudix superfamily)
MFKYDDLVMEIETGRVAIIEYGGLHSHVYCIKFDDGKRFQISETDLKNKFKKVHAICPRCGHHLIKSDLEEYKYLCKNCDENFYGIEVKQYI